jgi:DnaJ-class molecular chaperone
MELVTLKDGTEKYQMSDGQLIDKDFKIGFLSNTHAREVQDQFYNTECPECKGSGISKVVKLAGWVCHKCGGYGKVRNYYE